MGTSGDKADLHDYLQAGREAVLWKLEGVSEYDARRPRTPTGTNLLGVVKHVASVESEYFGQVFGRPFPEVLPWSAEDAEDNADMWAAADETREDLVALYRRVWAHSDATISQLPLDTVGHVPWWSPDRRDPTLHRVLVHMTAELQRHLGQMDIVRELVDGAAGHRDGWTNIPNHDDAWWAAYRARVEDAAGRAAARS